jgi:hypothetical protein
VHETGLFLSKLKARVLAPRRPKLYRWLQNTLEHTLTLRNSYAEI